MKLLAGLDHRPSFKDRDGLWLRFSAIHLDLKLINSMAPNQIVTI